MARWTRAGRCAGPLCWGGGGGLLTRPHQRGGKLLFLKPVQWLMLAVIIAGGAAFLGMITHLVSRDLELIPGAGAAALLPVGSIYLLQFITLLIHEWAHA